jgi:hypothetical protein
MKNDQEMREFEVGLWSIFSQKAGEFTKEYGISTVRSLILINGGASVALLAAISNIYSKNDSAAKILAGNLSASFGFFLAGLTLAVMTGAMGYFNFFFVSQSLPGPHGLHKYIKSGDVSGWRNRSKLISLTMVAAVILAVLSLGFFGVGSLAAVRTFGAL